MEAKSTCDQLDALNESQEREWGWKNWHEGLKKFEDNFHDATYPKLNVA